ncbi:MAG: ribonuclease Y [Bacteriovoracaceae bacterium]|nr:ribonuclease Y [Bacteriovoracaceae bacterium]
MSVEIILASILCIIVGSALGFFLKGILAKKQIETEADNILKSARNEAQDIKKQAKYEAKQVVKEERVELENEFNKRHRDLQEFERSLTKKEVALDAKIEQKDQEMQRLKSKEDELAERMRKADQETEKYKIRQAEIAVKLSEVAKMSKEEAKEELLKVYTEEAKVDAAKVITRIEEEAKEEAEKKAKRIIGIACQRFAGEYVAEQTISSVELPSDEIKGRIIGREGRNIRAFEQICGIDLVIDDTPGLVVISSFNVVRKQIAKMTLERLIADGRIHPAKIEEFYEKSKNEFEGLLRDLGEKAQMEIGVHGIHPEVLKMIGALNWRTSYTQNQYQHSLEVAFLCGAMAAELGLNVKQARRAGLLHDIGKVMDASAEGSHAVVGADFLKKFGETPDIVHAVRAHHEDVKPETVLAHLVMAGDALSGGRPGIRKALKESYVSRLSDIEQIVNSFEGVAKSYAISAGREIRVIVENEKISDEQTVILSRDIAKKIEEELSYPGSIKINVIRETRAIGVAR